MSNPAKLRVVQWATGGVGKAAIECVLNHPQLELAGCWVHSADKNGRDVGEILGIEALGVAATSSVDEALAIGPWIASSGVPPKPMMWRTTSGAL